MLLLTEEELEAEREAQQARGECQTGVANTPLTPEEAAFEAEGQYPVIAHACQKM